MALTSKKYEKFYNTTGSGTDKIDSSKLTEIEATWDADKAKGCQEYLNDPFLGPLLFQLQQMQDEIDYLRTEISSNKDKTTFPGFGTSNSTALVGDTKLISIGANTTVSFGDMVFTTDPKSGKQITSIVMTVAYTDPSSSKVTTKTTTLTLA